MTRLVLLRHGRTDWNHARRIQGQQDSHLDDEGHAAARRAAAVLARSSPSALWCSDLSRAADTAAHVAEATGLEPRLDARLREHALGEREGTTHDDYAAAHPEEYAAFAAGDFDAPPGAESTDAVRTRMVEVLDEVVASVTDEDTVVVVSHGAAIRVAAAALLGWPPDPRAQLAPLDNCAWGQLGRRPDDRGWRLDAWNRVVEVGGV